MQSLHVIMCKEDLDPAKVEGRIAVVFDVLFATSTIAAAFHHGIIDVIPTRQAEEARRAAAGLAEGSFLLAGEINLQPIPGFLPSVPLRLAQEPLVGKRLIYSTTNGTVALLQAESATAAYAAALVNGRAVADHLRRQHTDETILLVCAGSGGAFNIEDFVGAGHVIHHLMLAEPTRWVLSDAALAARELYRAQASRLAQCLLQSRLGRIMQALGESAEVEHAARTDVYDCVPMLQGQRLVAATAEL